MKPENSFVEKIKDQFDYLQVYETSPSRSKTLKLISNKKIIQAIKVKKKEDINLYKQYIGVADEFCLILPVWKKVLYLIGVT